MSPEDRERLLENPPVQGDELNSPAILPSPNAPMEVARKLVARYTREQTLILRHWRGGFWHWQGPKWIELEGAAVRETAYVYTEHAFYTDDKGKLKPWAPNRYKISNLIEALAAITYLPETVQMPSWPEGAGYDGTIVSVANGLLDVGRRELHPHDPRFFNNTAVPFAYDPNAPAPERWNRFLRELWSDDRESIDSLAEWFGYVISGRLDLPKILMLIGPTRAGKGVISRILSALVGHEHVCGPTLSSLNGEFGLQPLLGKTLAIVSDARLNGRATDTVVERLLTISGEDPITVNIKYKAQWNGKLPTRIMLCSNELPRLTDASMAIGGRFVPVLLERSFYGHEDVNLTDTLLGELPGILNFALDGLERLTEQGRFTRSPGADDAIRELQDLASPCGAFVRDRCEVGPDRRVTLKMLYAAYRTWCEDNGHPKKSKQEFGRDLKAALPGKLKPTRSGGHESDERERGYIGIAPKELS